jgi:hypothetical protein
MEQETSAANLTSAGGNCHLRIVYRLAVITSGEVDIDYGSQFRKSPSGNSRAPLQLKKELY